MAGRHGVFLMPGSHACRRAVVLLVFTRFTASATHLMLFLSTPIHQIRRSATNRQGNISATHCVYFSRGFYVPLRGDLYSAGLTHAEPVAFEAPSRVNNVSGIPWPLCRVIYHRL